MITVGLVSAAALLVIWLGYPAAIRILAAFRRPTAPVPLAETPDVSVIVASCDDRPAVLARIENILASDYPAGRLEVVVALDPARARSSIVDFEACDASVRVISGDAPGGKAASLNAAVRAARHEVLVFADTAQRFAPDAITALVIELQHQGVGAVSGMLELPPSKGASIVAERYWRYERWLRRWEARLHSCVGVTGAIYAMRRDLWEPLPAGLILDDVYVPMRLALGGWRIGFTDRALAYEARTFGTAGEFRRKVRTLTGNLQLCAWLPGVLHPRRNPLWLQFGFHKLARLLTPYLATLALLGAIAWLHRLAASFPAADATLGSAAAIAAALMLLPTARRTIGAPIAAAIALQASAFVATMNGLRGRWDVWT